MHVLSDERDMLTRKQIVRSWLKSAFKWFKKASKEYEGDAVDDQIKFDTKVNKTLGMPPTDEWCKKNPYRFL